MHKPSESFKPTELAPLPEEWEYEDLESVFSSVNKKERAVRIEDDEKYNLITVKLYSKGLLLRKEAEGKEIKTKSMYAVYENDFIFSKIDARNGAWGFVPDYLDGAVVSGDFPILRLKSNANKEFLEYALSLRKNWELLRNLATGTTNRKRIQPETFLKTLKIPLPSLPEQKRIAFVLSSIQKDIEATERVIEATRELKRSMMKHLFTYGPVSVKEKQNVKLKDTEIGPIPEEWEVVRLGDVFEKTRKPRSLSISADSEIPFIPMEIVSENKKRVSGWTMKKFSDISSGTFVFKNDLVIAKITPSFENGKQAILDNIPMDFAYCTTEVWAYHPKDEEKITTDFVYNYIKIDTIRSSLADKMEGTTGRKRLPKSALDTLLVPLPPLPEQQKIAEILSAIDEKIEAEERKKRALEKMFKTMLHNLMTGKVRVKDLDIEKYGAGADAGGANFSEVKA